MSVTCIEVSNTERCQDDYVFALDLAFLNLNFVMLLRDTIIPLKFNFSKQFLHSFQTIK